MLDSRLSFRRFIEFLKDRKMHEKTMKLKYLEFVISHFENRLAGKDTITAEEMSGYGDLLELIYSTLFPAIEDERDNLWALSVPMRPVIFYGTDRFYDLLRDPQTGEPRASLIDRKEEPRKKAINLNFTYSILIKRLYNFDVYFPASSIIHSFMDEATGASNYYRLNVDTRFIDIIPKEPLPKLDLEELERHLHEGSAIEFLWNVIPLTMFRFEGFSAITVTDITTEYLMESIKNTILKPDCCDGHTHYDLAIRSLRALAGRESIDFGLLPFLRVNGKPVFSAEICCHSVLAEAAIQRGEAEETYLSMTEQYYKEPRTIFYEHINESNENGAFFLKTLRQNGIKSYALLPVWYNSQLAGVLEVSSRKEGVLDQSLLYKLDIVLPLLAQLLQKNIDEFEASLKNVIKENFTSIQPAVEWKFNEAAWHYIKEQQWGEQRPTIETIYFENVYPLYGAIDIRNSTVERNNALRKDLETQFEVLIFTLTNLQKQFGMGLLEELIFQCRKWQQAISGMLTTAEEMELNTFLKEKVDAFFGHFSNSRPETAAIIEPYLQAIDENKGIAFKARRDLELSIQTINKTVNRQLESAMVELQKTYPSYFEKFRTDGVEYDIYIGQAIAPEKVFDQLYLRNLRLWQLSSMASIAAATHALLPQMPGKLVTTHLIFVHSNPIDISFRKDERRFDVEGGYNIRYQVVKKRVDKVHIRDSNERLTQPGKIAVIYFNEKEAEEYLGYVKYLQEKGVLNNDLEHLELEELQGVSGLRAFRVGVTLD
ncbi:MAG TPA: hypothetical protein VHC48_12155 [Puia sp.]|nr:hypothetical protein [Puia sp.]